MKPTPVIDGKKLCTKCGETKPVDEYFKSRKRANGLNCWCKICSNKVRLECKKRSPEKTKAANNRSYHRCKHNPEVRARIKNNQLKSRYGVEIGFVRESLEKQGFKCPLCNRDIGITFEAHNKRASDGLACVDHDHKTGMVRGVLCNKCNMAIGLCMDSPEVLERAGRYVRKHARLFAMKEPATNNANSCA